jgi:hypothetical protein
MTDDQRMSVLHGFKWVGFWSHDQSVAGRGGLWRKVWRCQHREKIHRSVFEKIGDFDKRLGPGASGSGEKILVEILLNQGT